MGSFGKNLVILLPLSAALSACWVKKTMCRGLHNALPGTCAAFTESAGEVPGAAGITGGGGQPVVTDPSAGRAVAPGFNLTRLTPEQLSNDLGDAVNFGPDELRVTVPELGQTIDYLVTQFGVPLGGIDFVTTSRRDPETKAQTLLVARVVAWQFAGAALWKDHNLAESERRVFTKCKMETDRPFQPADEALPPVWQAVIREGETRWRAQVDELFFRLYARPPVAAEVEAVKTAFLATFNNEGYAPSGWLTVLYAMLASQEFWHL